MSSISKLKSLLMDVEPSEVEELKKSMEKKRAENEPTRKKKRAVQKTDGEPVERNPKKKKIIPTVNLFDVVYEDDANMADELEEDSAVLIRNALTKEELEEFRRLLESDLENSPFVKRDAEDESKPDETALDNFKKKPVLQNFGASAFPDISGNGQAARFSRRIVARIIEEKFPNFRGKNGFAQFPERMSFRETQKITKNDDGKLVLVEDKKMRQGGESMHRDKHFFPSGDTVLAGFLVAHKARFEFARGSHLRINDMTADLFGWYAARVCDSEAVDEETKELFRATAAAGRTPRLELEEIKKMYQTVKKMAAEDEEIKVKQFKHMMKDIQYFSEAGFEKIVDEEAEEFANDFSRFEMEPGDLVLFDPSVVHHIPSALSHQWKAYCCVRFTDSEEPFPENVVELAKECKPFTMPSGGTWLTREKFDAMRKNSHVIPWSQSFRPEILDEEGQILAEIDAPATYFGSNPPHCAYSEEDLALLVPRKFSRKTE